MNKRNIFILLLALFGGVMGGIEVEAYSGDDWVECPSSGIIGDANTDNVVDIVDAFIVANVYVGNKILVENSTDLCIDATGNGIVDITDAQIIAQYYVGIDTSLFPVGNTYGYDSCIDNDGNNIWFLGEISGYLEGFPFSSNDYCVDSENVIEYSCNGDYSQNQQYSCGTDGYTENYCNNETNNLYKDYVDYSCSLGACSYTNTPELVEECEYGCTDNECNSFDYCEDSDGNNIWSYGFVEGNSEGVPFINNDYCIDLENVMENICIGNIASTEQNHCGTDGYGDSYCLITNSTIAVYKNFNDYSCDSGRCSSSVSAELVEECELGCTNGVCN